MVAITAAMKDDRDGTLQAGFDGLEKPISVRALPGRSAGSSRKEPPDGR